MTRDRGSKKQVVFALALMTGVSAAGAAQAAETIWIEAENARLGGDVDRTPSSRGPATISSPLLIKDDALASNGSYIEALAGNDSKTTMPATDGVTALTFTTTQSGTFRIWGRVQAATDGDDSFWVKMDNGSPIKWNEIPLGSSWHWGLVRPDAASNPPSTFNLSAGTHTLKIAYREDGTRLDALVVTSDTSYDPGATLTGAPVAPVLDPNFDAATVNGVLVSWTNSPGASFYEIWKDGVLIATTTGHVFTSATDGIFVVKAVASTGTTASSAENTGLEGFIIRTNAATNMSATPPMSVAGGGLVTAAGTAESLFTVPATGRGRLDFRVATSQAIKVWALTGAPNVDNDSFWVRVDQGAWIRWNGFSNFGCNVVWDSTQQGLPPVVFNLSAGSHFVEWAYREVGASLSSPSVAESTFDRPCDD
jgi:hypothetical protein